MEPRLHLLLFKTQRKLKTLHLRLDRSSHLDGVSDMGLDIVSGAFRNLTSLHMMRDYSAMDLKCFAVTLRSAPRLESLNIGNNRHYWKESSDATLGTDLFSQDVFLWYLTTLCLRIVKFNIRRSILADPAAILSVPLD